MAGRNLITRRPPWQTLVLGVDPGPVPGIALLACRRLPASKSDPFWTDLDSPPFQYAIEPVVVLQCLDITAAELVAVMVEAFGVLPPNLIAIERFVVGRRSARSHTPVAGRTTRDLIGVISQAAEQAGGQVVQQTAAQVKPWATEHRLHAAGLLEATAGMRHARDAVRHALFAGVGRLGWPDPLGRKAGET